MYPNTIQTTINKTQRSSHVENTKLKEKKKFFPWKKKKLWKLLQLDAKCGRRNEYLFKSSLYDLIHHFFYMLYSYVHIKINSSFVRKSFLQKIEKLKLQFTRKSFSYWEEVYLAPI